MALLAEGASNGYQLMQELEKRSGGLWRPSPGSVYPTLEQLEDEGLVRAEAQGQGRVFVLTDAGHAYVKAHADALRAPWEPVEDAEVEWVGLLKLLRQTGEAAMQVMRAGTGPQQAEARKILIETKRALYRLLAAEEDEAGE